MASNPYTQNTQVDKQIPFLKDILNYAKERQGQAENMAMLSTVLKDTKTEQIQPNAGFGAMANPEVAPPVAVANQEAMAMEDKYKMLADVIGSNPVASSAIKGAQKATEEMAYESIRSGKKDVNDVLADIVQKFGGAAFKSAMSPVDMPVNNAADANAGQPPVVDGQQATATPMVQQPAGKPNQNTELQDMAMEIARKANSPDKVGIIGKILGPIFGVPSDAQDSSVRLANISKVQGILGEEPLQAKDKAEIYKTNATLAANDDKKRSEARANYMKSINEPLSTAKELSFVESSLNAVDTITKLLDISMDDKGTVSVGNKELLSSKNFVNKNRQELIRARDVMINKMLRRDTGAAIGQKEEEEFQKAFGFEVGVKSFLQNPELIAKSVLESKDQLTRDRGRLSPNEKVRSFMQAGRARGIPDSELMDELEKRKMVEF